MKNEIKEMKFEYRNIFNHINNCALSNKNYDIPLTKHDCKLIIRHFRKIYKENEELQERIEKAIGYIKNINERAYKDDYGTCFSTYDLLSILQGVGKDE